MKLFKQSAGFPTSTFMIKLPRGLRAEQHFETFVSREETDLQVFPLLTYWGDSPRIRPEEKAPSSFLFWYRENICAEHRPLTLHSQESAGAVAAVLEDALLEEWRELTDGVFGQVETAVCVDSERRAGRRQHHPEQVPQITLQMIPPFSNHPLIPVSKQFLRRKL